ncbi:MAG: efflux RND transporter permease subunit, partial [Bacteroidetes bacterium]
KRASMQGHHFRRLMIFAVLTVAGLGLVPRLDLSFEPRVWSARVAVTWSWPGASPAQVEREVTAPLEAALALVDGVERIESVSRNGGGQISLQLDRAADPDFMRFALSTRIRQVAPRLPEGVSWPEVQLRNAEEEQAERPLLVWSLSGPVTPVALHRYALEVVQPAMGFVPGLRHVQVEGGNELEWLVRYDDEALGRLGLDEDALFVALRRHFQSELLGVVSEGSREWAVRLAPPPARTAEAVQRQLEGITLALRDGRLVRLGQVARVVQRERPATRFYRINGRNSIRLLAWAEQGVNTLVLARALRARADELRRHLPEGWHLYLDRDETEHLRAELAKIRQRTLWSLGLLLLFVLLVYRDWRHLAIVLLSLTANLGLAAIGYWLFGVQLHLYALAGITVSFGIIIDNSIVMMHHLQQYRDRAVFPALLASTLTTLAALVVIWFLPEQWQLNLAAFAAVLAINLAVSLVVALWLIPSLMAVLGFGESRKRRSWRTLRRTARWSGWYARAVGWLLGRRAWAIAGVVLLFGLPVFYLPNQVEGWEWYNRTLGHPRYVEEVKPIVNRVLGGTLRLFAWYVYEGSGWRDPGETVLHVRAAMPVGATAAQLDEVLRRVEEYVAGFGPQVRQYVTRVWSGQQGTMAIYFPRGGDPFFPFRLRNRLIAFSLNFGGVEWDIYGVGQGFSNTSGASPPRFRVAMYGYNRPQLQRFAERFAQKLLRHRRVQEVRTDANLYWWERDLYEYRFAPELEAMAAAGLSPRTLDAVLQRFDRRRPVAVRLPDASAVRLEPQALPRRDLYALRHQPLMRDSLRLKLDLLGQWQKVTVPQAIHKRDQQYMQVVEFEYTGSHRFGQRHLDRTMEEMRRELPLGYTMEQLSWRWGKEAQRSWLMLPLVVVLIFFICAVMFESLRQAFAVILLIPVSFIGIFLAFYWTDYPFDQGGYTSFLLLSGLSVNSVILLLNDYNRLRKRRPALAPIQAYRRSFVQKIVPILLTIVSTALGMVPFLMHGRGEVFWSPLAVGTIGGLIFSAIVVVWFIPLFFVPREGTER